MPEPLQIYPTPEVVVTFDPNLCRQLGVCVRGNPAVFDRSRSDWIRPGAASAEAVAELATRCPTGALQALRPGVRPGSALPSAGVSVAATPHGPIVVKGTVTLQLPTGGTEKRTGSFSLCRCGQTKRTPFCDGSHVTTGFRSPR